MTGQENGERVVAYKLNEIRMSGDTGEFSFVEFLGEKGEDGKYPSQPLGKEIQGVILKMRWRLFKYEEMPDGSPKISSTSEFDNKLTDKIVIFGSNEKGLAVDLKEKYGLATQRVLYVYLPSLKEIVRIAVKASSLSGDKNPNKEQGLFEYLDKFNSDKEYVHEYLTKFGSVERKDPKGNKRKDYCAMSFSIGEKVTDASKEKVIEMIKDVHERTSKTAFADEYVAPATPSQDGSIDEAAFDIPF